MSSYSRRKEPIENRRLLLNTAQQVVAEIGVEKLTLDAVAKRAALSKGGLLHHFPTKDALIEALFMASLEEYSTAIQAGMRSGQAPHLAYLQAALEDHPDEVQHTSLRILTQVALSNPRFIELLRQWYKQHILPDPDNCTPHQLAAILLADGVWYSKVFGIHHFTQEQQLAAANLLFDKVLV